MRLKYPVSLLYAHRSPEAPQYKHQRIASEPITSAIDGATPPSGRIEKCTSAFSLRDMVRVARPSGLRYSPNRVISPTGTAERLHPQTSSVMLHRMVSSRDMSLPNAPDQ
jgi:hypothetical protein